MPSELTAACQRSDSTSGYHSWRSCVTLTCILTTGFSDAWEAVTFNWLSNRHWTRSLCFYLRWQMWAQESGNPVRGQDCVHGRPVFWVCLKHLLDQGLQLIRQVVGKRRVCAPTHLQNQALPARCLELDTGKRCEAPWDNKPHCNIRSQKNTQPIIQVSWSYRPLSFYNNALLYLSAPWQETYFTQRYSDERPTIKFMIHKKWSEG